MMGILITRWSLPDETIIGCVFALVPSMYPSQFNVGDFFRVYPLYFKSAMWYNMHQKETNDKKQIWHKKIEG